MSFNIHTQSPDLKRELENKLAELEGQLDQGFEYEISAELLPREQALDRVENLANEIGAEAVFVAEGVFAVEAPQQPEAPQEEDPDFAMGLPPVSDEKRTAESGGTTQQQQRTAEGGCATQNQESIVPVQEIRSPRIDAQKIKDAATAKASQAGAVLQRASERTGSALKVAGGRTAHFLRDAGEWTSQKASEAKVASGAMLSRLAAKSEQWMDSASEWNARRMERRQVELRSRQERQRAAHREAELAAISAQIVLEQEKQERAVQAAEIPQRKPEVKPVLPPSRVKHEQEGRDMWPVWRNAFAASACITLVGVFLLATGSKQSSAVPATSTELSKPAVVVPSHSVEQPKLQTIAPQAVAQVPQKTAAKPTAHKHVPAAADEDDGFEEVTVRHYPNASPLAPPKKNSQGVVQISDME